MIKTARFTPTKTFPAHQRGMVLLVSLVFLLLLTLLGISSMQNATLQEKMAGSVTVRNLSFQKAEAALRLGESAIQAPDFSMAACNSPATCAPPAESTVVTAAGRNGTSGVNWVAVSGGLYGIQNLGNPSAALMKCKTLNPSLVTLYRVTAVSTQGPSRTVLESIYAVNC
ncbi:type IV pilus assembly protein PilX [Pseudomonas asturiensis]|uniref:Type IV pilus assembly protein PilX n=1 Tax=Pseudomonas asturiensis TaxID=1190415 RepID=A0A1M7PBL9_9PSED|nr:PilX N-terminal domain-containing pilus assembly protein [Pseudomonas asturiensis]SHN14234.1 type IV pilus assembly protein PilX [Pseudomonas asturiensis]